MSDASPPFDFSQFVPGFDFLKNLAGAASGASAPAAGGMAGLPSLSSWIAPTVSVEEVDKRIQELKTVQYWLEQNGHALKATIQALEVQKMTLSTLRGMNVRMEDLANAFTRHANVASGAVSAPEAPPPSPTPAESAPAMPLAGFFGRMAGALQPPRATGEAAAPQAPEAPREAIAHGAREPAAIGSERETAAGDAATGDEAAKPGVVDPMQWWGAITQQFQQIAESAMKEAAQIQMPQMPQTARTPDAGKSPATRKSGTGKPRAKAGPVSPPERAAPAGKSATGTGAARRPASGKTTKAPAPRKSAAPRRPRG